MTTDLSKFLDFMEEVGDDGDAIGAGFVSPPMPSTAHPKGRTYAIPTPDAKTGLKLAALAELTIKTARGGDVSQTDVARLRLDDREEREFLEMVLGDAFHQMVEDGVRWTQMKRLGMYAFIYFGISEEAANAAAEKGLFSGKAPAPTNRAQRRAGTKPTSSASAASKTTRTRRTA